MSNLSQVLQTTIELSLKLTIEETTEQSARSVYIGTHTVSSIHTTHPHHTLHTLTHSKLHPHNTSYTCTYTVGSTHLTHPHTQSTPPTPHSTPSQTHHMNERSVCSMSNSWKWSTIFVCTTTAFMAGARSAFSPSLRLWGCEGHMTAYIHLSQAHLYTQAQVHYNTHIQPSHLYTYILEHHTHTHTHTYMSTTQAYTHTHLRAALLTEVRHWNRNQSSLSAWKSNSGRSKFSLPCSRVSVSTKEVMRRDSSSGHT